MSDTTDIKDIRPNAGLDEASRVRLAASSTTEASAMLALADDPAVTVRATIALNARLTDSVIHIIARDPDQRVRAILAQRLAMLLPRLSPEQRDALSLQAIALLTTLATDTAIRVRAAISNVIKDLNCVPHALVMQLAQDEIAAIADPVIRLSPMLSDADLLALVEEPTGSHTIISVARRPDLSHLIAEVIADSPNHQAVQALLENHSAAISEATLDRLTARAAEQQNWQPPLLQRPRLSHAALCALGEMVTDRLLPILCQRHDLPPGMAQTLMKRLDVELTAKMSAASGSDDANEGAFLNRETPTGDPQAEAQLIISGRRGEERLCIAILAHCAQVPIATIDRAIMLRSAKGLLSLLWKAKFSMRPASVLQNLLLRLPPHAILTPDPQGGFPLSDNEMRWQIDFLTGNR